MQLDELLSGAILGDDVVWHQAMHVKRLIHPRLPSSSR